MTGQLQCWPLSFLWAAPLNTSMLQLITKEDDPTTLIPLADLKTHCRVEHTADDVYITGLMGAAISFIENESQRDFFPSTWEEQFPYFPGCYTPHLHLIQSPLSTISHVKYYDTDNTLQTMDSESYSVMKPTNVRGFIFPSESNYWPSTYCRPDAVQVRYTTGWATVPAPFVHAVKLLVGAWYEHREGETSLQTKQLELGVSRLIQQLTTPGYA